MDAAAVHRMINEMNDKRARSGGMPGSYLDAGELLRPPRQMTDEMRIQYAEIEERVDRIIRAQPGPAYHPDPEYMEIGKIRNPDLRREILDEIAGIFDFRGAINDQGIGYVVDSGSRPYWVDRLDPTALYDEAAVWWEQTIKQFYPETIAPHSTAEMARPSGRMPRLGAMQRIKGQVESGLIPRTFATLDIETTGLLPEMNEIWQIAIRGSDGAVSNMYFDTHIPGTTRAGPLSETLLSGVDPGDIRSIDDIDEAIELLEQYDAVVGQNVNFDLGFLLRRFYAMGRSDLAERIEAKFLVDGHYGDNVYDTLQLGRHYLPGMEMSDELTLLTNNRIGRGSPFSLENVLLESNLLEIMTDPAAGYGHSVEDIYFSLQKTRLHDAFQDTLFEDIYRAELFKLMQGQESQLRYQKGGFQLAGITAAENLEIRGKILESAAVTPYTKMDYDQVDDVVMESLKRSRYAGEYIKDLDLGPLGRKKYVALNPVEHEMIMARETGPKAAGILDTDAPGILRAMGAAKLFDDIIGDDIQGVIGRMPSLDQYQHIMETLARANVPHANLSPLERLASIAMAGNVPTGLGQDVGERLGSTLLVSEMRGATRAKVFKSGRIFLPMDMLAAAEEAGVFGGRTSIRAGEEMFRLSPFTFGEGRMDVSANFLLSPVETEAKKEFKELQKFIANLADDDEAKAAWGLTDDFYNEFAKLNFESFKRYGIQVGSLLKRDFSNEGAVRMAYEVLTQVQGGIDVDFTDQNQLSLAVGRVSDVDEEGAFRIGPTVTDKGLEGDAKSGYFQRGRVSNTLLESVSEQMPIDPALRNVIGNSKFLENNEKIAQWHENMANIYKGNKTTIKAAVAATAITAGYYIYKRREKKAAYYNDPLQQQPTEEAGWYNRYEQEMTPPTSMAGQYNSPRTDPMATQNVVSTLDRQRIGHHRMSSDKNNHLFGG